MAFVRDSRIKGLVFVPDDKGDAMKRHPCPDCFICQLCPEIRCGLCMKRNPGMLPAKRMRKPCGRTNE